MELHPPLLNEHEHLARKSSPVFVSPYGPKPIRDRNDRISVRFSLVAFSRARLLHLRGHPLLAEELFPHLHRPPTARRLSANGTIKKESATWLGVFGGASFSSPQSFELLEACAEPPYSDRPDKDPWH